MVDLVGKNEQISVRGVSLRPELQVRVVTGDAVDACNDSSVPPSSNAPMMDGYVGVINSARTIVTFSATLGVGYCNTP